MTYLELVQRLRQECGVAGDGPLSVVGQTKEMKRLCDWIQQSLIEIEQIRNDWEWMRKPIAFDTTIGAAQYAPYTAGPLADNVSQLCPVAPIVINGTGIPLFSRWLKQSFKIYLTSVGVANEIPLSQTDYTTFRNYYLYGTRQITHGRPTVCTVAPDRSVILGLVPDNVYTVKGEYYRTAQKLVADTDIPTLPEEHHMVIVYRAMEKYGLYEAAQEQIQAGKEGYALHMNQMMRDYVPPMTIAGPMI